VIGPPNRFGGPIDSARAVRASFRPHYAAISALKPLFTVLTQWLSIFDRAGTVLRVFPMLWTHFCSQNGHQTLQRAATEVSVENGNVFEAMEALY
jgi:hypothetical protein